MPETEVITEQQAVEQTEQQEHTEQTNTETENPELAKSRAELARMKAALDKATKEAGDYRKALRAKQSAEEIAAEEQKAADEARDKELNDLRKRFAVMETQKSVLLKIGGDEDSAAKIADYLYGAEDVDGALLEIQKIITAKEKALRLEYGKIPAPGAGGSENEDTAESRAVKLAGDIGKAKAAADKTARDALSVYMR